MANPLPIPAAQRSAMLHKAEENGWLAATTPDSPAFPCKRVVHAGLSGPAVPAADIPEHLHALRALPRNGKSAAYVHLPYCESKCLYCGFFGGKHTAGKEAAYLDALLWDIAAARGEASTDQQPIHALYLGGGTPTAFAPTSLSRLLKALRETLPLANDCEITVEGRVHDLTEDRIEACLAAGANRFSLGVQTFDTAIRRSLGRFSDRDTVLRQLERLAAYDEAAVVIDLIYGLPGQSLRHWEDDVRTFAALPLDGVDLYQLNVFPQSGLARAIETGVVPAPVLPHEQQEYFLAGLRVMHEHRCRRLSASHWGRTSRERNLYNPLAKIRADCLHFGAGAGGSLHGHFLMNETCPDKYIELCRQGIRPTRMMALPPAGFAAMRTVLAHMEQCRLHFDELGQILGSCAGVDAVDVQDAFAPLLDNWQAAGLLTRDAHWMELTPAGQFWQVNLTSALLGWQGLLLEAFSHE